MGDTLGFATLLVLLIGLLNLAGAQPLAWLFWLLGNRLLLAFGMVPSDTICTEAGSSFSFLFYLLFIGTPFWRWG